MNFKDVTLNISEEDYRQLPYINYSLLKTINDFGPLGFEEYNKSRSSSALSFGTLVDTMVTNKDNLDNIFYSKDIQSPTASLLILANALLQENIIEELEYDKLTSDDNLLKKAKSLNLWSKMSDDVILSKIKNDLFFTYIKESINARGKIILDEETRKSIEYCANTLLTHNITKDLFIEQENIEVIKQAILIYNYKEQQCKAKLDLIRVDHKNKIIYPYDIKTGSDFPSNFNNAFYYWKYYIQVISYMLSIYYIISTIEEFKDYTVADFQFIYISKKLPETPVIYTVENKLLNYFYDGWTTRSGDKIKGFNELFDDCVYYMTNDIYTTERKIIENKSALKIELL